MKWRELLLVLLLTGLVLTPAPARVLAGAASRPAQQTAPCYLAAMQALTRQGALYSQGGHLPQDPIDPSTGSYYPRTGPNSFDCSGLVWWSYAQAGVTIGSTTYQQLNDGVPIDCTLDDLHGSSTSCWTLGDLVFLRYSQGQHVAIYVGAGLFMDCYNHATGCILHNVAGDSFYQAHFYQARRIVSGCEGLTNNPGQPSTVSPTNTPDLEEIPDLLAPLSFLVPQCNACGGPDAGLLRDPPPSFADDPILYPFKWLATAIKNTIIDLICWLLSILQTLVNIISQIANSFIYALNQFWKLAVFSYITIRAAVYLVWSYVGDVFGFFSFFKALAEIAWYLLNQVLNILLATLDLIGALILLLVYLIPTMLNILSWIGAIVIGLFSEILLALQGTSVPIQLGTDHIVYHMVRGALEGFQASQIGWLFVLGYAFAYIGFILWFARFISSATKE